MNLTATITPLEWKFVKALAESEYHDDDITSSVCTNCVWHEIEEHQVRGVISSLIKKDLIEQCGNGAESTVWLTETGAAQYNADKS